MRLTTLTAVIVSFLAVSFLPRSARADVKTKEIEYKAGETTLLGFLAWDDAVTEKRPGVLVIHEWWGHNQHARAQAERAAKAGYVAFALDMYGKGKVATHPKDAQAFLDETIKDPAVAVARFNAGLETLKAQPQVDPEKIAVIGYCFGGGVALNMARAGADIDAVASFHGGLAPFSAPAEKGKVKAKIFVATGAADPMVPKTQVDAFAKEMKAAGVKPTIKTYPKAKHGFTNPEAGTYGMDALAYDADADKKSWDEMLKFLKQVFKK
jgi:dienelactone hydrolase